MNKVLLSILISLLFIKIITYKFSNKKEILIRNNIDQVYQTKIQEEFLSSSDLSCVFRCTSPINKKEIENKYKETINNFSEKEYNIIQTLDQQYYCTSIKPLYVVKL
jgi:hypothetical protein